MCIAADDGMRMPPGNGPWHCDVTDGPLPLRALTGPFHLTRTQTVDTDAGTNNAAEFWREVSILKACRDVNIVQFVVRFFSVLGKPPGSLAGGMQGGPSSLASRRYSRHAQGCRAWTLPLPPSIHPPAQGAALREESTMLVTEYCEGGNLANNIAAGRVTWYRRGRKVCAAPGREGEAGKLTAAGHRDVCRETRLSAFARKVGGAVALAIPWCSPHHLTTTPPPPPHPHPPTRAHTHTQHTKKKLPKNSAPPKIALDVAKALVFLHSRRIVHFDLKSPNILLARCGGSKGQGGAA